MRAHLLLVATLVACGNKATTPAGPAGASMDFRSKLDPTVAQRAPSDEKATRHEMPADLHGVKAKLVWRTFEDGPNEYIDLKSLGPTDLSCVASGGDPIGTVTLAEPITFCCNK